MWPDHSSSEKKKKNAGCLGFCRQSRLRICSAKKKVKVKNILSYCVILRYFQSMLNDILFCYIYNGVHLLNSWWGPPWIWGENTILLCAESTKNFPYPYPLHLFSPISNWLFPLVSKSLYRFSQPKKKKKKKVSLQAQ